MKRRENASDSEKERDDKKGIMGYRMLDYRKVEPILMQLRSCATQHPGFIAAEFLVTEGDCSVGVMISTSEMLANWKK